MSAPQAIGVDVGGTKIAALRVSAEGTVETRATRRTPAADESATLSAIDDAVEEVRTDAVVAIGVGAAGLVDVRRGVLLSSPNLSWRDVPLRERLLSSFGLPVTVDNDATAGAWAETVLGASRGVANSLFVGVGTGIGGGIVQDGRLVRGAHGFAGEIGHLIVEPNGPPCGCGNLGCWEQVASGQAIARAGRVDVVARPDGAIAGSADGDPARVTGELVTEAARRGDGTARSILAAVGLRLGQGIAGLVNVLDPEIVVVGGGAGEAGDLLLEALRDAFHDAVEGVDVRPDVPIVAAALGNDAGAIGAALVAMERSGA
ncbi:MAG TPA: ROK family protein [Actinomycetota bacterium]|nr:ROK family protein [Actinomycetota bacterium]